MFAGSELSDSWDMRKLWPKFSERNGNYLTVDKKGGVGEVGPLEYAVYALRTPEEDSEREMDPARGTALSRERETQRVSCCRSVVVSSRAEEVGGLDSRGSSQRERRMSATGEW